jgi:hypothetical protein
MEQTHIDTYNKLKALASKASRDLKQERGRQFEILINDILEKEGILLRRSYHTSDNRSEQIDGAIEVFNRVFLIEVKWVESNMAASELYAFIGKTENKFYGTLGVFISKEELSENFLNSLNKGRRQSIIVIHGNDLDLIFSEKVSFKEYLTFAFKLLSYDNTVHFPVEKYLKIATSKTVVVPSTGLKENVVSFLKTKLLSKEISSNELLVEMEHQTPEEKDLTFSYIIKNYSTVFYNSLKDGKFTIVKNFDNYIKIYKPADKGKLLDLTKTYYTELTKKSIELYAREYFIDLFSQYYSELTSETKTKFEQYLIDSWNKHFDNYDKENQLTDISRPIWEHLTQETKSIISNYYLDIFISTRGDKFSQKKFANHLLSYSLIDKIVIEKWLDNKLVESKNSYEKMSSENIEFISYTYVSIAKHLNVDLEKWTEYIAEKIKNIS